MSYRAGSLSLLGASERCCSPTRQSSRIQYCNSKRVPVERGGGVRVDRRVYSSPVLLPAAHAVAAKAKTANWPQVFGLGGVPELIVKTPNTKWFRHTEWRLDVAG